MNLKLFGHILYDTDDYHMYKDNLYTKYQSAAEVSSKVALHGYCLKTPLNTVFISRTDYHQNEHSDPPPLFYCNFRTFMTCWIFVPSFITSLFQIFSNIRDHDFPAIFYICRLRSAIAVFNVRGPIFHLRQQHLYVCDVFKSFWQILL